MSELVIRALRALGSAVLVVTIGATAAAQEPEDAGVPEPGAELTPDSGQPASPDPVAAPPPVLTERQQLVLLETESYAAFVRVARVEPPPSPPQAAGSPEETAAAREREESDVGVHAVAALASRLEPREALRTARALATRASRATEAHQRAVAARQQATQALIAAERAAEDATDPRRGAEIMARAQAAEAQAEAAVATAQRAADQANAALVERLDPDRAAAARTRAIEDFRRSREARETQQAAEAQRTGAVAAETRARIAEGLAAVERARALIDSEDASARNAANVAAVNATWAARSACTRWANAVDDSEREVHPACEVTYHNSRAVMTARREVDERAAAELRRLEAEEREAELAWRRASDEQGRAGMVRRLAEERVRQLGETPENLAALEAARAAYAEAEARFTAIAAHYTTTRDRTMVLNNALAEFQERTQGLAYSR